MVNRKGYQYVPMLERRRYKDFVVLKEYEDFYLCGKYKDGELLYKECFTKFDIDGVEKNKERLKSFYTGKMHRGGC